MLRIYQRGGNVAKSKFDYSLLKPVSESKFDTSKLTPLDDEFEGEQNQESGKGLSGIAQDISKIPGALLHFGLNYPGEVKKSWGQVFHHPLRAAENALAGLGETAIGAFNLPHDFYKYLAEKEIPGFKTLSKIQLHIPDLGIEKKLGLDKNQEGDLLLRMMGGFTPLASPINKLTSINKVKKTTLANAEKKLAESELSSGEAHEALTQAEKQAIHNLGGKNPDTMQFQLKEAKNKAEELKRDLEQRKLPSEIPPGESSKLIEPLAPSPLEEPILPQSHIYEELSPQTERLLKTKEQKLAEAEEKTKKYLGEGQIHHERFANKVNEHVGKVENENTKLYKNVDKLIEDKSIPLESKVDAKQLIDNLFTKIPEHGITSEQYTKLAEEMSNLGKADEIPVKKFLKLYRTTRNEAFDRLGFAKENPNTEAGNKAYEAYTKLKAQEEKMLPLLKKGMGEDTYKEFQKAQTHFKEKIAPMRSNPTFREIAKRGKVSGSILEKLIGNEEGQHLLQGMTKNDPELMRLAVGQEYAGKPHKLFEPSEQLEQRFFPHMPELTEHMENLKNASREHAERLQLHKEAQASDVENASIAKQREAERIKIQRAHEGKKTQLQRSYEKAQKQFQAKKEAEEKARQPKPLTKSEIATREKMERDHKKLQDKIQLLEKTIPDLETKAKAKKQSLEEKNNNMMAYEKAKDDLYRMRALIKKGGKLLVKYGSKLSGI